MKKLLSFATLTALLLLSAGCTPTQEIRDGVSFEGKNVCFIDTPQGADLIFRDNDKANDVNIRTIESIKKYLSDNGYVCVDKREDAQIVFRPLWSASSKENSNNDNLPIEIKYNMANMREKMNNLLATLEIQATIADSADVWQWRGFSPIEMTQNNFTQAQLDAQVKWCLEYFPPEKHPSRLQLYKEERKKRLEKEANPFAHIVPDNAPQKVEQAQPKVESVPSANTTAIGVK